MNKIFSFIFITTCLSATFISCKKDKFLTDTNAKISFSQDSVLFDTVFTTIGSTTRQIRVRNMNKQKINISSVRLQNGNSSMFTLNVDGTPGKSVSDVEILAEDSIYIFIQVNVNPTSNLSPFVIQDKILFDVNGNEQSVALEAWGQDAYYHFPNKAIQYKNGFLPYSTVSSGTNVTVNWVNDKPHVIYGWLVVDSTQKLTIAAGVKVYFHQNAGLWVYRYGTLQVNGSKGNEVIFQGDRRELDYADIPGQWDRIWINEGHTDNYINYAIIKNSYIGVQAEVLLNTAQPKRLRLTNTIIKNCSRWGIYGVAFNIWGSNNIVVNCKEYCAALTLGGNYTFLHSTFANYFTKDGGRGNQPCVHLDNYSGTTYFPLDSAYFGNCIIDGSKPNELEIDIKTASSYTKNYKFNSCLLKTTATTSTTFINNVFNQSASFIDVQNYDCKLGSTSAARAIGDASLLGLFPYVFVQTDILGVTRSPTIDAGANQFP